MLMRNYLTSHIKGKQRAQTQNNRGHAVIFDVLIRTFAVNLISDISIMICFCLITRDCN